MFTICTIANDLAQYQAMRESFLAAGFDETRCAFRLYDNSARNEHDPFVVISSLQMEQADRFFILCHQDVRIDKGVGYEELLTRLNQLSEIDPQWAVAGNYGITLKGKGTGKVNDPNSTQGPGPFPQKVVSLDENFIVIRPNCGIFCTAGLRGFHLYATDLCLNAYFARRTCYVIDFELTHLSGGDSEGEAFRIAAHNFISAWNPRFALAVVGTPNTDLRMSKWKVVRVFLKSTKVCLALDRFGVNYISYPGMTSIVR